MKKIFVLLTVFILAVSFSSILLSCKKEMCIRDRFVYEADENKRVIDLSKHEGLDKDILFLQPHYRELHADFYDSPTKKVKFKRYFAENSKICLLYTSNNNRFDYIVWTFFMPYISKTIYL